MGRKVLLAAICCLTLSQALAETEKTVNSSVAVDNESAESAPGYHNIPYLGVYASTAPYNTYTYTNNAPHGSHSFKVPAVIVPRTASSEKNPVHVGAAVTNPGFIRDIKDSYGRFVQAPQAIAFQTALQRQFVPLQQLPRHLAQALVSTPGSNYQFKTGHNYFFQPQGNTVTQYNGLSQPLVYAQDIKNFVPSSFTTGYKFPTPVDSHITQTNTPESQTSQDRPATEATQNSKDTKHQASDNGNRQTAAPAHTLVTTVINGKKTVLALETRPPVPHINLDLLEPLYFATPEVTQMQHFLPKIPTATYHKLPSFNAKEIKTNKKDITKTKAYINGYNKTKLRNQSKGKPRLQNTSTNENATVTIKGNPNGNEFHYEISTPDHKEVGNEHTIKYNKETNIKPIDFKYTQQTHQVYTPEIYTYVHSSNEPLKVAHLDYHNEEEVPKTDEYNSSSEDQDYDGRQSYGEDSGKSDETSAESELENGQRYRDSPKHQNTYLQHKQNAENHGKNNIGVKELPKYVQHKANMEYYDLPKYQQYEEYAKQNEGSIHTQPHTVAPVSPMPSYQHIESTIKLQKPQYYIVQKGNLVPLKQTQQNDKKQHRVTPNPKHHKAHQLKPKQRPHPGSHHIHVPTQSHQLNPEHRAEEQQHRPNQGSRQEIVQVTPKYFSQPIVVTTQNAFKPITPDYEENIAIVSNPQGRVKVYPNSHIQIGPQIPQPQTYMSNPFPASQMHSSLHAEHPTTVLHSPFTTFPTHFYEKSERTIKKDKEQTPDKKLTSREQHVEEEENSEEDFENAYKESAFGFPAYEQISEDVEKDIFNPESYGRSRYHDEYINDSVFQQYQDKNDGSPKSLRDAYKDDIENSKEDYFLEYDVNKPESLTERAKSKLQYYKMFKKNRPEKVNYHDQDNNDKEKKAERFTVTPSFDDFGSSTKPNFGSSSTPNAKVMKFFAQYKHSPIKYEYDYSKETPRDNNAHASVPYHKYRTHLVEPQFQYGFEPITSKIVLDSELAAMASNDNPKSEKQGTRKKIFKENWYIQKTSTSGSKPS